MEHLFPTIELFGIPGFTLNLTVALMSVIVSLIVILIAMAAVRRMDVRRPSGMQNFLEAIIDFIRGLAKDTVGAKHADEWVPLGLTLFIWIFVSNQIGLITNVTAEAHQGLGIHEEGHYSFWMSPTANFNVAMAMGIAMVLLSHFVGLRRPGEYFKHWVSPNPAMLPLHLVEELPKFLTLGLRLFGNIFAGEVLLAILVGLPLSMGWVAGSLAGGIPMLVWLGYSMFVGTVQAFVFTVLTLVYIGQKLPHGDH
ncbi:F0F1 ATP synthase subunit A [Effusibacillus lacus]|uniref:ATP synthase subunit a n=2 Tax=Effusibacillus lacus TaxID=1348429 RepID=A0A292YMI4_9BACL|nr:F0F1 ATP synthase subunit A [Effusibacillus lacus]GAX89604.1 F0F1 ATP synthase subunit A [Effusibacillus lacus]